MSSITEILNFIQFSREALLESIAGLSVREMTTIPVYEQGWTPRQILAHILGWDRRVVSILPLILAGRADDVPGIDVPEFNRQSIAASQNLSVTEILARLEETHRQILEILDPVDHIEIDLRRQRRGRTITIRSYVIDIMAEHERQHAVEIELWRKTLDEAIDPEAISRTLHHTRTDVMARLHRLDAPAATRPASIGQWSVSEVVGHLADWEERMRQAAEHIASPNRPIVPADLPDDEMNAHMAAARAGRSWPDNLADLQQAQQATDAFLASLELEAWRQRGPYPWPDDQGTLAELIGHMAGHYADHLPHITRLTEST